MPDPDEHEEKIIRNKAIKHILEGHEIRYNEWIITAVFYITIHLIEKYFAQGKYGNYNEKHPDSHLERLEFLESLQEADIIDESFLKNYNRLYNAARVARYKSIRMFDKQYGKRMNTLISYIELFDKELKILL
jgi:hypothetical protein